MLAQVPTPREGALGGVARGGEALGARRECADVIPSVASGTTYACEVIAPSSIGAPISKELPVSEEMRHYLY